MYRHADDVDIGPLGFPIALHGMGSMGLEWSDVLDPFGVFAAITASGGAASGVKDASKKAIQIPTTDSISSTAAPRATPAVAVKSDPVSKPKTSANAFDAVKYSPNTFVAAIWSRVGDLQSFGGIDLWTMYKVNDLLLQNRTSEANSIVTRLEDKLHGSQSNPIVDKINDVLPDGFKLGESAIGGVPNFVLYAGAGFFGALLLRSAFKKR